MSSNNENQIKVVKRSRVKPSNPKANPNPNPNLNSKSNPKANLYNSPTIVEPEQQIKNGSCINTLKMQNGFLFVGSNTQFIKVYDMRENSDNYFKEITKINIGKGPVRDIFFVGNNLYVTCGIKKEDTKKLDGYFSYPISYKKFIVSFDNLKSNNSSNNFNITEEYAYPGVKIPEAILRRSRPEKEKGKPRNSSFEYNNGSKNFYYSKTNEERQQRREELTNVLKKEEFKNKTSQSDMNEINSIVDKILDEENNAKKLFENPKLTKKKVWEFQMNIDGTFNNLESRKQMKKILNQTERNRRKEIINAPRSSEEEKRRKKIVANILTNKNKGKGLPQNLANKIANMSREQPPPPTPPPPPPRTHAEIQANNNQLDNAFWDGI